MTSAASETPRRKLPIGLQTFGRVREEGCYYVDKDRHLNQPIHLIGVEFSRSERNISAFEVVPG